MPTPSPKNRNLGLAACAVAIATAMGGSAHASAAELEVIDQIQKYCTVSWRNAGISHQEWDDCTQQALVELLDRISQEGLTEAVDNVESDERRELNRTVWRTVQRWRRRLRTHSLEESQLKFQDVSSRDSQTEGAWDQIAVASESSLSERQQRILSLLRDGWRVSEIADELQIPQARVSDEKYKAIVKLRSVLGIA